MWVSSCRNPGTVLAEICVREQECDGVVGRRGSKAEGKKVGARIGTTLALEYEFLGVKATTIGYVGGAKENKKTIVSLKR